MSTVRKVVPRWLVVVAVLLGGVVMAIVWEWFIPHSLIPSQPNPDTVFAAMARNHSPQQLLDLRRKSNGLRAAIIARYAGKHERDIHEEGLDSFVQPFVKAGMSFQDAEAVLRGAGFSIDGPDLSYRTTHHLGNALDWHENVLGTFPLVGWAHVTVILIPGQPMDYGKVTIVDANASDMICGC